MRRLVLLCGLLMILAAPRAWAVDPAKRISQYAHSTWRIEDGFFSTTPQALAQSRDGYLWIGTDAGLVRFDGVRFVPWRAPDGKQLASSSITSLLAARDGSLWIGTWSGLSHWVGEDLVNYSDASISAIAEDRDGTVWVTRSGALRRGAGVLCQIVGAGMRCHGDKEGLPFFSGQAIAADSGTGLWVGGDTGLAHGKPGSFTLYNPAGLKSNQGLTGILELAVIGEGAAWVGINVSGPGLGLQQLVDGVWKPFVTPDLDTSTLQVLCLLLDRQGVLWVGTYHGLYRIHGKSVDRFAAADGLTSDFVTRVFEDREGNIWVATSGGLDCFRNIRVSTISSRDGWNPAEVNSVFASRDGTLWISVLSELDVLRQDRVSAVRRGRELPGTTVTTVFEDHAGQMWVGIDRGLSIYENGRFTPVTRRDGRPLGLIVGMTEDIDQNVWAEVSGDPRMLVRIRGRTVQEEFAAPDMPAARKIAADPSGGVWLGLMTGDLARFRSGRLEVVPVERATESWIHQIAVNPDGSVWAAAIFGLVHWKEGQSRTLTTRNGLPCNEVNAFVEDARGGLWLYMQCGLVEIPKAELDNWWKNPQAAPRLRILDVTDGVRPGYAKFQGAARTPDGRLWFANGTALQVVDPAHLEGNTMPPPVVVEQIVANGTRYPPRHDLRIPPVVRDLQIDYTAMTFGAPQRVQFRYQLEGHDHGWQDPGTRRQAFYSDLGPGHYRFRVKASNNDGVWNDEGATLDFTVLPAWYQTAWFVTLSVSFGLAVLWLLYRLRLRQLAVQFNLTLDARVSERTRIARDLHDTLLQSVHALLIHIQAATNLLPGQPQEARSSLEHVIDRTSRAIAEGRDAVQDLRSSTVVKNELAEAINVLGEELIAGDAATQAVIRVNIEGTPRNLRPILRDDVYRIAAEALRNAVRHANARLIQVDLRYDDRQLRICVRDDGDGIDAKTLEERAAGHFGLSGMRERAALIGGRLEVTSQIGSGTQIDLRLPGGAAYAASSPRRGFRLRQARKEMDA
jgi:signal transduction histidine kinase/ligand-binding sensor domain-containing protein